MYSTGASVVVQQAKPASHMNDSSILAPSLHIQFPTNMPEKSSERWP